MSSIFIKNIVRKQNLASRKITLATFWKFFTVMTTKYYCLLNHMVLQFVHSTFVLIIL